MMRKLLGDDRFYISVGRTITHPEWGAGECAIVFAGGGAGFHFADGNRLLTDDEILECFLLYGTTGAVEPKGLLRSHPFPDRPWLRGLAFEAAGRLLCLKHDRPLSVCAECSPEAERRWAKHLGADIDG